MLDPDVRRVLDGASIAHLATVLPDGSPHTVPLWIGAHGDRVVFLTGPGSRKARNLRRDPRHGLIFGNIGRYLGCLLRHVLVSGPRLVTTKRATRDQNHQSQRRDERHKECRFVFQPSSR